jgi:hypothetical protein
MCDFSFGRRGYGRPYSARTPHPIVTRVKPIFGQTTVFSIPHAAVAAGLLKPPHSKVLTWPVLMDLVRATWRRSPEAFLRDAADAGATMDRINMAASILPQAIIGWPRVDSMKKHDRTFGVCSDLPLTLAAVSRRAGDLVIRSREPDFSWGGLFKGMIEVDLRLEEAPVLSLKPWSAFSWEEDRKEGSNVPEW